MVNRARESSVLRSEGKDSQDVTRAAMSHSPARDAGRQGVSADPSPDLRGVACHEGRLNWFRIRGQQGTKNDLDAFERQGFIRRVNRERVEVDYRGAYQRVVERVRVDDVVRQGF